MSDFLQLETGKANIFHIHIVGTGIVNKYTRQNQYVCGVSLPKNSKFVTEVTKYWEENKPFPDSELNLFKTEYERDENGNETTKETGNVVFFAKASLVSKQGKKKVIKIYDSKNNLVPNPQNLSIGNGTLASVNVAVGTYEQNGGGLSCYLNAVKILKLKEFEPEFSDDFADDEDEELFESQDDLNLSDDN